MNNVNSLRIKNAGITGWNLNPAHTASQRCSSSIKLEYPLITSKVEHRAWVRTMMTLSLPITKNLQVLSCSTKTVEQIQCVLLTCVNWWAHHTHLLISWSQSGWCVKILWPLPVVSSLCFCTLICIHNVSLQNYLYYSYTRTFIRFHENSEFTLKTGKYRAYGEL